IVFFDALFPLGFELFRCAIAVVRASLRDETRPHRAIAIEAFGLEVRRVRAANLGAFVPVETQPAHAVENPFDHLGRRSLGVSVFDAKDQRTAEAASEEPVEERSARAADVQISGGRRGEADAGNHLVEGLPTIARSLTCERRSVRQGFEPWVQLLGRTT